MQSAATFTRVPLEEPDILAAAREMQPPRSKIAALMDSKVGILGFFSGPDLEGMRKVSEVFVRSHATMLLIGDISPCRGSATLLLVAHGSSKRA